MHPHSPAAKAALNLPQSENKHYSELENDTSDAEETISNSDPNCKELSEQETDDDDNDNNNDGCHDDSNIVTDGKRAIWRQCLKDVQSLYIPDAVSIRPMKTQNAFVTKAIVLLAYLIVHANSGEDVPRISGKFKIDPLTHRTADMEEEIIRSGVDYINTKLKWNTYKSAETHIDACSCIGSWLATQLHKAKHHGTWRVINGKAIGSPKGLYEPYRDLLNKIGIIVPSATE